MLIRIAIIGLGQIGTSIGLALAAHQDLVSRVGYDVDPKIVRKCIDLGAIDHVESEIKAAVRDADLILLSLPIDQIREMMVLISEHMREGAVIMDTGPIKEIVASWAGEYLPPERHYVGLTPVLNPAYLHEVDYGIDAAHPDLFKGGLMAIVAPPGTSSQAIKLAADLTRTLGASPLFADPAEIDGLMAATHLMPQLLASALLNATIDQPGWREGRKVAGRAFAEVTSPVVQLGDPQTLRTAALLNQENVLRIIDNTMAALQALRNDIQSNDADALEDKLARARQGREIWWQQRQQSDWVREEISSANELPRSSELFSRWFGFGKRSKTRD